MAREFLLIKAWCLSKHLWKLIFLVFHIYKIIHSREEQESYARGMIIEELDQRWEGLGWEVAEICRQIGLPNACNQYLRREEVLTAMESHHFLEIRKEMEPPKKLDKIKMTDTRRMQKYMIQKSLEKKRSSSGRHEHDRY